MTQHHKDWHEYLEYRICGKKHRSGVLCIKKPIDHMVHKGFDIHDKLVMWTNG